MQYALFTITNLIMPSSIFSQSFDRGWKKEGVVEGDGGDAVLKTRRRDAAPDAISTVTYFNETPTQWIFSVYL